MDMSSPASIVTRENRLKSDNTIVIWSIDVHLIPSSPRYGTNHKGWTLSPNPNL